MFCCGLKDCGIGWYCSIRNYKLTCLTLWGGQRIRCPGVWTLFLLVPAPKLLASCPRFLILQASSRAASSPRFPPPEHYGHRLQTGTGWRCECGGGCNIHIYKHRILYMINYIWPWLNIYKLCVDTIFLKEPICFWTRTCSNTTNVPYKSAVWRLEIGLYLSLSLYTQTTIYIYIYIHIYT